MSQYVAPSISTHVPLTHELPQEDLGALVGRKDIPPPSLWQNSVKIRHKVTGKSAVVVRVDWGMNMFRAFYPDEANAEGGMGRFSERTEWEHCRDWDVEVTFSPAEIERQAARKLLEDKIASLDAKQLAMARVLCDDEDPAKGLGKLELLIQSGLIKLPAGDQEVSEAALGSTDVDGEQLMAQAGVNSAAQQSRARGRK